MFQIYLSKEKKGEDATLKSKQWKKRSSHFKNQNLQTSWTRGVRDDPTGTTGAETQRPTDQPKKFQTKTPS